MTRLTIVCLQLCLLLAGVILPPHCRAEVNQATAWLEMAEADSEMAAAKLQLAAAGSINSAKPLIFGHRGGSKWAPENTLAAFRKCIDAGIYGIELDIHRCKSGELVVIHDENVKRTTDGTGLIKDKTYDELKQLSAGAWFGPEFKDERIPKLSEVLDLVDGKMVINIEIKNAPIAYPGIEEDLITLLDKYKYRDKIIISSFDHDALWRVHQHAPSYAIALLGDAIMYNLGRYAQRVGAHGWNPYFAGIRADNVAAAHSSGLKVGVWTPNTPEEWKSCTSMGVDSIITDDPLALTKFFSTP